MCLYFYVYNVQLIIQYSKNNIKEKNKGSILKKKIRYSKIYEKKGKKEKMDEKLKKMAIETEQEIEKVFKKIDIICEINSEKVINAFWDCDLQEAHLNSSTGYGIDEPGRNKIEEIYSKIFKAEDSLVRTQLISGTHALAVTLSGILRPRRYNVKYYRRAL